MEVQVDNTESRLALCEKHCPDVVAKYRVWRESDGNDFDAVCLGESCPDSGCPENMYMEWVLI